MNALPASGQRSATGVDLRDGLKAALAALGARVEFVGGCTAEDAALFSHRRDGVTGRQAAVVVLT
jgi:copper oxidase (laccase) domain-containing protein